MIFSIQNHPRNIISFKFESQSQNKHDLFRIFEMNRSTFKVTELLTQNVTDIFIKTVKQEPITAAFFWLNMFLRLDIPIQIFLLTTTILFISQKILTKKCRQKQIKIEPKSLECVFIRKTHMVDKDLKIATLSKEHTRSIVKNIGF